MKTTDKCIQQDFLSYKPFFKKRQNFCFIKTRFIGKQRYCPRKGGREDVRKTTTGAHTGEAGIQKLDVRSDYTNVMVTVKSAEDEQKLFESRKAEL